MSSSSLRPRCKRGEYQAAACLPANDTVCKPITECGGDEFLETKATSTTDNVCSPITDCVKGEEYLYSEARYVAWRGVAWRGVACLLTC